MGLDPCNGGELYVTPGESGKAYQWGPILQILQLDHFNLT